MTKEKKPKKGFTEGYKTYDTKEGYGSPLEWRQAFHERLGIEESERVLEGAEPFMVLGITSTATWNEILAVYRKMAMKYHPDKFHNDAEAIKDAVVAFKRVQAAFELLERKYKK